MKLLPEVRRQRPPRRRKPAPRPVHEWIVLPALLVGGVLLSMGLISMVGAGVADQVGLVVVVFVGSGVTAGLVRSVTEARDRAFIARVVVAGVLLRLGTAILIHSNVPAGFFAPDQLTYQSVGHRTLLYLQGSTPLPWQLESTWEVGYFYWNAFLFWIFGYVPLVPKLANCFFGVWVGLVGYRLAGELVGQGGARRAAVLLMFFPSMILWSSLNLRDTLVVLVLATLLLSALRLRVRATSLRIFGALIALVLLAFLRDYMAVMAVFALVGSFLLTPARSIFANVIVTLVMCGVAMWAYQGLGLGSEWVESASFEALDAHRELLATGTTTFRPGADVSTPLAGLRFLPLGLAFFFLAPFPWHFGSSLSLMTLPEMLVWYGLLPFVVYGAWFLLRHRFNRVIPIMVFTIVTSSVYGLVEANAGTAYRHRAQILVFFLVFAAVGLDAYRRRNARKPERKAG